MEPDGIVIFQNGRSREKITMGLPLTHFVLLRFLAYGEIPRMSADSHAPMDNSPKTVTENLPPLKSTMRRNV